MKLLRAISAALGVEAFRISFLKLLDIALRDVVHRQAKYGGERADVPEAVTKLLGQGLLIKRRRVKEVLLDELCHFA